MPGDADLRRDHHIIPHNRAARDGGTGDDSILGGAGVDTIQGGTGNDIIDGGTEADSIDGGDGNDTLYGGTGTFSDTLIGGIGNDQLFGGDGNDSLDGGTGDDTLDGGIGDDTILAGSGNDIITGGDGNDLIDASTGDDQLSGGLGNDTMLGGTGNDIFDGGAGADQMTGGGNDDLFLNLGAGDVVDGSEDAGSTDTDTLDLTSWGKALTNIIYDPLNHENGTVQFLNNLGQVIGSMTFSNIENVIPCFTPGTLVETDRGPRPVESLREGDRVLTRDSGYRPVLWTGRRDLGLAEQIVRPELTPVLIEKDALAPGVPARDMLVSPQHRMLLTGARAELIAGETEVLAAATHLTARAGIRRLGPVAPVSYIHLLFEDHEIIRADGAWSESFQPGQATLDALADPTRAEILALFPSLATREGQQSYKAARLSLRKHEARALMAR